MESADRIEITFKSGETISYGKGEWDDYAYDGKAIIVKQKGAWIGIYTISTTSSVSNSKNTKHLRPTIMSAASAFFIPESR